MEQPTPTKLQFIFQKIWPHKRLNRSLRILITTNTTMNFVVGLFAPFYAVYVVKIGGSVAIAGISWALFSIVAGLLTLLFSNWELKIKEQELLMASSYVLKVVVFLSYAFMTSLPQLFLTQIIWGISSALNNPAFDALYTSHTSKDSLISEWGGWEGISAISTGAAALVGGIAIEILGYQSVFIAMAIISLFLAMYIWRLPREVL